MKRLGITGKLVASSVCIFVALGLAVTWYSLQQLRSLLYEETVRRVEAQTLMWIEANTTEITLTRAPGTLGRLVRELQERERYAYVVLADAEGRPVASSGLPGELDELSATAQVAGARSRTLETRDHRYFEVITPISASGTGMNRDLEAAFGQVAGANWGAVRVGVEHAELDRRLGLVAPRNVLLYAVLVLAALGVNIFLARRMVTPITIMGRAATQIAAGHLSERVTEGARLQDEVGELVRNFNQMAEQLTRNRDEMNLLYSGLEEKVRERTLELEQANQRLQELDAMKSHLLSTVSHEFRSPLTSIKAFAQILLDSPNPDEATRRRFLEIIDKESDRLSRLISDLLDLAKIESDAMSWCMGPADLRDIAAEAVAALASQAVDKRVRLAVADCSPQPVWGDADRLQQVVTNLVSNAIKFCPAGGSVELRLDRASSSGPRQASAGDYARVAVEDTGPGISAEDRERVFEKFYQGPRSRASGPGTGLGLAICREIVLRHHGEIWVESEPGQGSTFYFTVPAGGRPAETRSGEDAQEGAGVRR